VLIVAASAEASFAADCKTSPITASTTQLHKTRADALGEAKFNWVQKVWRKSGPYWHNHAKSMKPNASCSRKDRRLVVHVQRAIPCRSHA